VFSYSILAPNAIPSGFVDGKVASEKILAALNIGDNYRIGHTKVFFKAGILGQLEEMREDKLSKIVSNFQARIRGYLIRKNYSKLCDQRWVAVSEFDDWDWVIEMECDMSKTFWFPKMSLRWVNSMGEHA